MKVSFIIGEGSIDINSITIYKATKDFLHFHIDTTQKYPDFIGSGDNYSTLHFGKTDDTCHQNDKQNPTIVEVVGIFDWFLAGQKEQVHMTCDTGRYGFNVCIWKQGKGKTVWEKK